MNRITAIVGAGAILDFDLPEGVHKPSTAYITEQVVGLHETNSITGQPITEIIDAYNTLKNEYPTPPHFEMLFHVLEMWYAYGTVWRDLKHLPKNPDTYPVFAPFVRPRYCIDVDNIHQAIKKFLLCVMDIVNSYNAPYLANENFNRWYRDFWRNYAGDWDVFNLNYDTTIDHTLAQCEDGFEDIPGQDGFQHFVPQKLWANHTGRSTMSHLHGCIEFFDERYKKEVYKDEVLKYDFHDLYKYSSYDRVRGLYEGSTKSCKSNQSGEQYFGTPIITGLRKNDKLNIIPFDFYHGHLFNCILRNNALLLVGYSFGDLYMNHVIQRMELIHGKRKRVVLIDYWPLYEEEAIASIDDPDRRTGLIRGMMREHAEGDGMSHPFGDFLCRMTDTKMFDEAATCFQSYDRTGPMVSTNGCLMLFIGGFKAAVEYKSEIYEFLNS